VSSHPARLWIIDGHLKEPFFSALLAELPAHVEPVTSARAALGPDGNVDLVLLNDETWPYCGAALAELRRRAVPSLHLADGILEWSNLWGNPRSLTEERGSPLFQPVLSDKIACIGRSQARFLEALGNVGRCEVTGMPRLDPLLGRRRRQRPPGEPFRILVATARQPGFTEDQLKTVEESLADVRRWFETCFEVRGIRVVPVWRLTAGLGVKLGIRGSRDGAPLVDLATQLSQVDAVLTTPSTLQLEAMLLGLPVALLDYSNRPHLVPAAFTVSAPHHLDKVLGQLLSPPPERLLLQETLLDDALECRSPAAPRVADLIDRLVFIGRRARRQGEALVLPERLLSEPSAREVARRAFVRAELHPGHPLLSERDVEALQAEVVHLRRALRLSPSQIVYRAFCEVRRLLAISSRA
jgi:hypothetical protein